MAALAAWLLRRWLSPFIIYVGRARATSKPRTIVPAIIDSSAPLLRTISSSEKEKLTAAMAISSSEARIERKCLEACLKSYIAN